MNVIDRKGFIGGAAAFAGTALVGCASAPKAARPAEGRFIKAALLHLGSNMWCDRYTNLKTPVRKPSWNNKVAAPYVRADDLVWHDVTAAAAKEGLNLIVVDIGEALVFPSHPEIAVKGSWTPEKMRRELDRLRGLGLEPVPKLNFSSTHNAWMGKYRRITGSEQYLQIQRELILDAAEIFGGPRLFHLGWDEETYGHQGGWGNYEYCVVRRGGKWWNDFLLSVEAVREAGSRAWCFSDQFWYDPDGYRKNMPKDVVQCPWNCVESKEHPEWISTIAEMGRLGYDVIADIAMFPGKRVTEENGSWVYQPIDRTKKTETRRMMEYCRRDIPKRQLLGFVACPWVLLQPGVTREVYLDSLKYAGEELARFERESV